MPDLRVSGIKVKEAMTQDYGFVDQSATLDQVIALMLKNNWEEVLVADHHERLVGLVTKKHLVRQLSEGVKRELPIREVCNQNLITTSSEEDLIRARDTMRYHGIGRLPVLEDSGQVMGLLTARDVCNGFSNKLELLGEHMHAVMENIIEAIRVIDCQGIVRFWNHSAEKLFGVKAEEIVGRKLSDFFPDDSVYKVISSLQPIRNVLFELQPGQYIIRNIVPVTTPNRGMIGVVCTARDVSQLKNMLEKLDEAKKRVKSLEKRVSRADENDVEVFYTVNASARRVLKQAERVALTDATVLIQGESGTGKELLANVICRSSSRARQPFIEVNCSAIPESLFESEMFGYDPGTFTGANRSGKPGKFEMAHRGTIFLDEVGELSLEMQAKLLRVIQERRFYRVGGTTPIEVDVRLIAATNRDIGKLVAQNKFREDLFYRLNVVTFEIPPLRARKEDIPGLTERFVRELGAVYRRLVREVAPEVIELFTSYDWPGNVRQLHNVLENVIILMDGCCLDLQSLSEAGVLEMLGGAQPKGIGTQAGESSMARAETGLDSRIASAERDMIIKALEDCNFNKLKAAEMLGIPRSTLYYKLRTLGISV